MYVNSCGMKINFGTDYVSELILMYCYVLQISFESPSAVYMSAVTNIGPLAASFTAKLDIFARGLLEHIQSVLSD